MKLTTIILLLYFSAIVFDLMVNMLYSYDILDSNIYNSLSSYSVFSEIDKISELLSSIGGDTQLNTDESGTGFSNYYNLLFNGAIILFNIIVKLITIPAYYIGILKVFIYSIIGENSYISTFIDTLHTIAQIIILVFAIQFILGR